MALDDYDPSRSLTAYFPERGERRLARLWAREKVLHDFADLGAVEFFEGSGSDPTEIDGYATNKLWLRVEPGVTEEPGEIRCFKGGDPTLLESWPILDREGFASHLGARAGAEFDYVWSDETSGDPGTGKVRGNHATLASITELALSKTGRQGQDYGTRLISWASGDSVRIYGVGSESSYVDLILNDDPSDEGDCVTVACEVVTASTMTEGQLAGVAHAPTKASLAEEWATKAEDQPVDGVRYSAFHWAQKAEASQASAAASSASAGVASGRLIVKTFAELATVFGYTADGGRRQVAAGDIIIVLAIDAAYEVLATDAATAHLDYTGSDGVKVKVLPGSRGYDVRAFGATADGNTDDSDAIQAAIDAASDGGGAVYFPAGVYICSNLRVTTVTADAGQSTARLNISGDGHSSILRANAADPILHVGNTSSTNAMFDVYVGDLNFDGDSISTENILLTAAHRIYISRCKSHSSAGEGIKLADASFGSHVIEKCLIRNNGSHGVYVPGVSDGGTSQANGNALKLLGNTILFNGGSGVKIAAGNNIVISFNDISSNGDGGVVFEGPTVKAATVIGNYLEDHWEGTYKGGIFMLTGVYGVTLQSNYVFGRDDKGELYGIYADPNAGFVAVGNYLRGHTGSDFTGIHLSDGSYNAVTLLGNRYEDCAENFRKPASGRVSRLIVSEAGDGGGVLGPAFQGLDLVDDNPGLYLKNLLSDAGQEDWTLQSVNDTNGRSFLSLIADGQERARFERDAQMASNDCSMWLAVNRGGTITLSQVSVGAEDSGGVGFRLLRVPN